MASRASVSCVVCRKRKIKCDGSPDACNNCRKFGTACTYAADAGTDVGRRRRVSATATATVTQAGLERRRVLWSCTACKRAKSKCSGGRPCERCGKRGLACAYEDRPRRLGDSVSLDRDSPGLPSDGVPPWLTAQLPPMDKVRELVDVYFARVHPMRCLGFLHIPSFLERLQDEAQLYADASGLLHAMCALAAPFVYAELVDGDDNSDVRFYEAGRGWAATALQRVLGRLGAPDVDGLAAQMLLHEHQLRCGEHAQAFVLSGVIARQMQLLQLHVEHVEHDRDVLCRRSSLSWVAKESRRRLVWSGFLLDASVACGVDQLRFVHPADIQVQLPCAEERFVRDQPCVTEMLPLGEVLPFARADTGISHLDLRAFYIRAVAVRARVLQYVKHLDGEVPWDGPSSHFSRIDADLRALEAAVPDDLRLCPANTGLFRAHGRLGLYFGLHILLAQTAHDLYRVGVDNLVFPLCRATRWIRAHAPPDFLQTCHRVCASKAVAVAALLQELWHSHRPSLVDIPYAVHAQVCSSVLLATLLSWRKLCRSGPAADLLTPPLTRPQYRQLLQSNVRVLAYLRRFLKADLCYESASQVLKHFDALVGADADADVSQFSLEYTLNRVYPRPVHTDDMDDNTIDLPMDHGYPSFLQAFHS